MYCTATDADGREYVRAYGCTHIPIAPGVTKKDVRMFTPIAQNRCLEFFGIFKDGNGMVIDDPELIAKGSGREIARVKAGGKVKVSIQTT